jgi:dTDP-4-amino-4,6-dideoxygalactose transaminase
VFEDYPRIGYNFRITDIQAAVGPAQLDRLDDILARAALPPNTISRRLPAIRYSSLPSARWHNQWPKVIASSSRCRLIPFRHKIRRRSVGYDLGLGRIHRRQA